jgi:hypothetical protein
MRVKPWRHNGIAGQKKRRKKGLQNMLLRFRFICRKNVWEVNAVNLVL